MQISRRAFLNYCQGSAAALGLTAIDLAHLEQALASPTGPTVVWLQGSSCTGCSISFLNRISTTAPKSAGDVVINTINLVYHPQLMSVAGQSAASAAQAAYNKGGYILVVEGGVPTAFNGSTCWAWNFNGQDVTFKDAVSGLASKAAQIVCAGTCSSYGGIPAAPPNPAGVKSVSAHTLKKTINVPGCPTHPDWIVWVIARLLTNSVGTLDSYGRPTGLFGRTVHDQCPRRETEEAKMYGQDNQCVKELGCKGPTTVAPCPINRWNNGVNWCVDANAQCIGCTNPGFPGTSLGRKGYAD
jgi:hydrogenase small subunit